ncbi:MAG: 4-hydroxy-tetrahydrodipicolinate reductase [Clostridiales bacterium]|nr:4-hydroxy-tetrahydrodipicolinate reductase [Clostridiales bacterium]
MISVILHGACGHMGHAVAELCAQEPDMTIVAGVDARGGAGETFPVYRSLSECTEEADVIIDFSTAGAVDELIAYGAERMIPIVLCTTGLTDVQVQNVKEASEQVAILRSGNMSLGINLLMRLLKQAAETLCPNGFDPEIVEMHHNRKLDAPSGTALMLADSINAAMQGQYSYTFDRHERRAKRDPKEIGISSLRGGTVVGVHDVLFAGQDEVIEFRHTAYSRAVFAKGAVAAARFLAGRAPGLYDMSDVIGAPRTEE